jgi:hypothetical protein
MGIKLQIFLIGFVFLFHLLPLAILHWYFKRRLEELSTVMDGEFTDDVSQNKDDMDLDEKGKICKDGEMDVDECYSDRRFSENSKLVKNIGKVVLDLRSLGFTSMAEDAYASAIFLLLKVSTFMKFKIWIFQFSSVSCNFFFHLYVALVTHLCLIIIFGWVIDSFV